MPCTSMASAIDPELACTTRNAEPLELTWTDLAKSGLPGAVVTVSAALLEEVVPEVPVLLGRSIAAATVCLQEHKYMTIFLGFRFRV